ncbi:MAG: Substrate-binding protein of ABC transporter [uncultured bacterium]|uniref:Periplasmic solute binding protein n=3 Tax=Candidatus Daviesiibacteriota TaxID=1752718 RepID=A0A0G0ESI0_9BACT|nr:MAG: Substrate-binding protein of ABC transporter [uncultured bacterium]KKQ09828.1 MAG: Periplasmic solute binding protein [Candidatus Daviesbacteria bacterium GW2011_GWB1_36_5]KKQ16025.1 MAG: Periplasmic solute binding protein [Candidatus Daviesbacteria bacterium GW2011_GWA1_36_8]OGE31480.1 MAG: hypothetical protein A3C99_02440 [Candidatus Daviesbacteria bacterium RIFCSPHIGHO2_02_FULL_37_9]OGE36360.1 MAG: hypothetical protein A3E66_05695 [Candidatus Daviesbacteria bacterium RIFCSPHIGHO2_12_
MRILSLLPAATEIIFLLGLEKNLVGVSHECDYPAQVKILPKVTSSPVSNLMSSLEIDKAVKKLSHKGPGIFHINSKVLGKLKPDLILTQELCEVCAVGFNKVKKAARILDSDVKIISLEPESVEDILDNIKTVGDYTNSRARSRKIVQKLRKKIDFLASHISPHTSPKPKVLIIEWLDPVMIAGHWVPEMVELAGGECLLSNKGEKSVYITPKDLKKLSPDIIIFAPCGFDISRTLKEKKLINDLRLMINESEFYLMDGNSFLTRPGPRVIDGVEIFSEIIHPEILQRKHTKKDWQSLKKLQTL